VYDGGPRRPQQHAGYAAELPHAVGKAASDSGAASRPPAQPQQGIKGHFPLAVTKIKSDSPREIYGGLTYAGSALQPPPPAKGKSAEQVIDLSDD